jgi:hypothetical protein
VRESERERDSGVNWSGRRLKRVRGVMRCLVRVPRFPM